jgi:hypothetical protein
MPSPRAWSVAFGPTVGRAVNGALLSDDRACGIGISIDGAAVSDPALLTECLREGFEEILDRGGAHEPVQAPLREPVAAASERPEVTTSRAAVRDGEL